MKSEDAEEYTQALGQVVAGGWRQIALGERLGVPKALGLDTRQWVEQRLGGYVRMSVGESEVAVGELSTELTERDISNVTGIPKSTVHRIKDRLAPNGASLAPNGVRDTEDSAPNGASALGTPLETMAGLAATEKVRKRAERIQRDEAAKQRREIACPPALPEDDPPEIRLGDFREVLADLSDVDAIITDPPYGQQYLPLLRDLTMWADHVLAPDGLLAVMFGQSWLPDAYRLLSGPRRYRWTLNFQTPAAGYASADRRVQSNWKPVLVYGGGPRFGDVVTSVGDDKDHHRWGQNYEGFAELVRRLSGPGALVVDPFTGGGTTALACRNQARRFVGAEIDPEAYRTAVERVSRCQ